MQEVFNVVLKGIRGGKSGGKSSDKRSGASQRAIHVLTKLIGDESDTSRFIMQPAPAESEMSYQMAQVAAQMVATTTRSNQLDPLHILDLILTRVAPNIDLMYLAIKLQQGSAGIAAGLILLKHMELKLGTTSDIFYKYRHVDMLVICTAATRSDIFGLCLIKTLTAYRLRGTYLTEDCTKHFYAPFACFNVPDSHMEALYMVRNPSQRFIHELKSACDHNGVAAHAFEKYLNMKARAKVDLAFKGPIF